MFRILILTVATQFIFGVANDYELNFEPIAIKRGGKFVEPPIRGDDAARKPFLQAMQKGKSYPLYNNGIKIGSATILRVNEDQLAAECQLTGKAKRGIATTIDPARYKHTPESPLSRTDQRALMIVARKELPRQLVNVTLQAKFYGRDIDNDGKPEVIADFFINDQKNNRADAIFLVVSTDGKGHITRHRFMRHVQVTPKDLMAGASMKDVVPGFLMPVFFDNFDFDHDGKDEIIRRFDTFEGTWYQIWYQKTDRDWDSLYEFYRYRQAY